jgi:hypothetical protein
MVSLPLLALLVSPRAQAADTVPVLVSAFESRSPEAAALAALVENFVAQELRKDPALGVLRVEDAPAFADYSARTYMKGCPPGEFAGCTLVVAERAEARWAVTGTVEAGQDGAQVSVEIVDVAGSRVALGFRSELQSGSDETFAEGVARVVVAAAAGAFAERDIRAYEDDADPIDGDAVARQLDDLSRELGDVTAIVTRNDRLIEPPAYTLEDLARDDRDEGASPWERLQMTPEEYLRYKNSGLPLVTWRKLSLGRSGQLLLRPFAGLRSGPWSGNYYGRYAYDVSGGTLVVVDALSSQTVLTSAGGSFGAGVSYGVLPYLDVGAVLGGASGGYTIDIDQQTVGQADGVLDPTYEGDVSLFFGPRALVSFLPTRSFRPVAGAGLLFVVGPTVNEHVSVPPELITWPAPLLAHVELLAGAEARLSDRIDLYAHVPIAIGVVGTYTNADRRTSVQVLSDYAAPPSGRVGAGIELGIQIRLFGSSPTPSSKWTELELDEPEE